MISARPVVRSALPRAARAGRAAHRQQLRFQSTSPSSSAGQSGTGSSHFATGIAGGLVGAAVFYGAYSFTPAGRAASNVNTAARKAEKAYQEASKKLQEKTPNADEAASYIKDFAYSYVGWIPGGRAFVDSAFKDWETVRKSHGDEADKLVNDAYKQFQDLSKSSLSLETASKAYEILADLAKKVASLSGDALGGILDNHPKAKEKLGGNVDQLKDMSDKYGPEVKKQVDDTWRQVKDILSGGLSADAVQKARSLIDDKTKQLKKLGDEAWKKGLEEAQPILDKNPKIKELVERNADALKSGNAKELFEKAKSAVDSGDLGGFEKYVNSTVESVKSKGSGLASGSWANLDKYVKMIPQGDQILPKLQQLGEVAEKHKDEGEKLLKETLEELTQVLEKKSQRAEEIVQKAKKDAPSSS